MSAGRAQPEAVAAAAHTLPPIQVSISAAAPVLTILRILFDPTLVALNPERVPGTTTSPSGRFTLPSAPILPQTNPAMLKWKLSRARAFAPKVRVRRRFRNWNMSILSFAPAYIDIRVRARRDLFLPRCNESRKDT